MSNDTKLNPAFVRAAKSRAQTEIASANRLERAALQTRAKALKLAEVWGFHVFGNEVGDKPCGSPSAYNEVMCLRPEGHAGKHRSIYKEWT